MLHRTAKVHNSTTTLGTTTQGQKASINTKMKKPETLSEKMWRSVKQYADSRFRGVMLVMAIPVLLVVTIFLVVPRKSPLHYDQPHSIKELRSHGDNTRYAIVLDAGSTGSRVHVFHFEMDHGDLKLISDTFEQLKPGLSSYADEPQKAAESLRPLLETALKTVPTELQATTPISLKATAGLRLLPGGKADAILEAVTAFLKTYPFKLASDAVSILDGMEEGGFAWLTLNYLLGKLGKGPEATVAAVDLGGGSVQEAFALAPEVAKSAPKEYTIELRGAGTTYQVYVHSYLGYGLMAGRAKVISQAPEGHACFHKGFNTTYKYGGKDYPVKAADAPGEFKGCATTSTKALNVEKSCGIKPDECTFDGVWHGVSKADRPYYVSSYFWDRAQESGIISDKAALSWKTTPEEYAKKAGEACSKDAADVVRSYPAVKPDQAPFFCLDLSLCHQLLTAGFRISPQKEITLVKQIEYNGQNIEASWALGAAVNDLSKA